MGHLNTKVLPEGYLAEAQVHIGSNIEVDVATLETASERPVRPNNGPGGVATLEAWAPPRPALIMPAVFPDDIEVRLFRLGGGEKKLVAAIEMVSPANKDRPESREAFAIKCASYLYGGVGVVVVDVVTERRANLHDELIDLLNHGPELKFSKPADLYAVSYHPVRRGTAEQIEVWPAPVKLGELLPVMPLPLLGGAILPLNLEETYVTACQMSGIRV